MYKKLAVLSCSIALLYGCASVPMEPNKAGIKAKEFSAPQAGNAGLYIYRPSNFGAALKKDVWLNDNCVGETAPKVFFYQEIIGDTEHKLSTESEFSPNHLLFNAESGKNYFVEQYIKLGAFVGGANLRLIDEEIAKNKITKLRLATPGRCSKDHP